ncbi:Oxidoreductase [Lachnellula occidentalis]|uniref:Oxidoreductase n=1 Tax=Lachnellula occidentalis TaxID=215460 RepID=A0A8H8S9I5_9HELO|nr:Oxidoreductase [Lachnellula occidentalis]
MKTVVILGGSYGGISTAHRILKQAKTTPVKIILVSPNTHHYWNIAGPRALVPGQIPDDKIFQSIAPGFKQYPANRFEFVLGSAESLDAESKKVTVAGSAGQKVLDYDILILATGSSARGDVPLKGRGSTEATKDALHVVQQKVKQAKDIHIAGAGSTGVELAGELAFEYKGQKNITLIASGPHVLEGTPASVTKTATKQLRDLKVTIKTSSKVMGDAKMPDGRTELTLSGGEKIITDLYLPALGLVPNSSYLPHSLVNTAGFVKVDEFLRVKGTTDVWALGDVADVQRPQYVNTEKQSVHVAKSVVAVLKGAQPVKYKKEEKDMLAVPIGRKAGTGHMGGMKLPSFMVNMVKGKNLFMDKMPGMISGSAF